ncbi:hypothetical protein KY343_06955 [Candidatus Woesearchaeota archaeon]|nr:hypothetical protein [Candidatus Woesearchaeota archaeon]
MKFYLWLFLLIIFIASILPDIDHIRLEKKFPYIKNLKCMYLGFIGNIDEFNACPESTHKGRELHSPYIWALTIGLTIGGLVVKWGLDYNMP